MNQKSYNFSILFLSSLLFHAGVLTLLCLSLYEQSLTPARILLINEQKLHKKLQQQILINKQLATPKPKITTKSKTIFKMPLPAMSFGNTLDATRKPGSGSQLIKQEPQEHNYALIGAVPCDKQTKLHEVSTIHETCEKESPTPVMLQQPTRAATTTSDPDHADTAKEDSKKPHTATTTVLEHSASTSPLNVPIVKKRKVVQRLLEYKESLKKSKSNTLTPDSIQPVTLSDLVSSMIPKTTYIPIGDPSLVGEGYGQHVVIKEGDMRYYSVWRKLLHHMNQTAQYNHIRNRKNIERINPQEWQRMVKRPCGMSLVIQKDGTCTEVAVLQSSGYEVFDRIAVEDAWSGSPYPPLPDSITDDAARFEVFRY